MTNNNQDSGERPEPVSTSSATRRIVVQALPPQQESVIGRKLDSPIDTDWATDHMARGSVEHEPRASTNRRLTQTAGGNAPQRSHEPRVTTNLAPKPGATRPINVKKLLLIIGVMIGIPSMGIAVLLLLPSRAVKRDVGRAEEANVAPASVPQEIAVASQPSPVEITTPDSQLTNNASTTNALAISVESIEIRSMSVQLASQISQKSGFEFAPEFVEVIRSHTEEYKSRNALEGARKYRREINKSFRDEGLNPLIGYALAMSRSKFDPTVTTKGLGIWQIPPTVARSLGYLGSTENSGKLKVADSSAQITSNYTKQLLSAFDPEDFMYAIACFGMNLQEAGRLQARLVTVAPDAKNRRDITKMIRAGVLSGDQVDNIARFFAAGIVGENPQKFGLEGSQPFSSLY